MSREGMNRLLIGMAYLPSRLSDCWLNHKKMTMIGVPSPLSF
ncbi:hypothetical protein [Peribacillus asahii]|nr:hypothetical protein [Peribacillus asahii]